MKKGNVIALNNRFRPKPQDEKDELPPFNKDLNRKWLKLMMDSTASGRAFRDWVAKEVKAGRDFNDPKQFNIDEWLE